MSVITKKGVFRLDGVEVDLSDYSTLVLEVIIPDSLLSDLQLQSIKESRAYAKLLGIEMILVVTKVKKDK